ncbi:Utp14 protein-domain-containing protein [Bisporella sp. PMI_857]|nr:Utp14 protein-domain-containing protein [Bisporella sp. PMI_857]
MNLDEDEVDDGDDDVDSDDEDDLGDDAVDLAAMLDATEEEELASNERNYHSGEESGLEDESEDGEQDSDVEDSDEDSSASSVEDASNPAKLAALQSMVADLPQNDRSGKGKGETQNVRVRDSSMKLTMDDVGLGPTTGVAVKSVNKTVWIEALHLRRQKTLDRCTVKHNRRAEHLMFPLPDNDVSSAKSNNKLQPTSISKPFNELEATIQSILEESGLATASGQYDEDRIREFETLQTNKMSIEEVKARRDQLRIARELLFREEVKAKRIKKIKSKSYRKVHRKQREKEERMNKEALAEGGFEPSEDELEAQNRRRATERMGQKHRGSKWAKSTKESGRAAWDEDARAGITDMARRDEELRKRVDGQMVRREIGTNSGESSGESDHYDSSDDDSGSRNRRLLKKLETFKISGDEDSGDEHAVELPFAVRDQELIKRAFAGADVVGEFESEKRQTIIDEDEKVIDNTLPGWGNWTGEGLSKREKARNKGRFLTKLEGIKRGPERCKADRVLSMKSASRRT